MDKQEAISTIDNHGGVAFVHKTWIRNFVKKFFNDVKTSTCENCKHYRLVSANDAGRNIVNRPPPTFGCNKFERATNG